MALSQTVLCVSFLRMSLIGQAVILTSGNVELTDWCKVERGLTNPVARRKGWSTGCTAGIKNRINVYSTCNQRLFDVETRR